MNNYDQVPGRSRAPSDVNGEHSYPSQEPNENRSPLGGLNFLKNFGAGEKKQTKDGQPQKRRGPKPDSKPALTRRQELNRQAQRTHRERKEHYIKKLEYQVMQLTEVFGNTSRERDQALDQVRHLKDILAQHGIHYELNTPSTSYNASMPSYTGSTVGSHAGSYRQDSTSTALSPSPMSGHIPPMPNSHSAHAHSAGQLPAGALDYDQLGIDFVLACERPCLDHKQYLVVRSHNPDGQPHHHPMERADDMDYDHMSGHALMATCPPMSHIMDKPGEPYPHQMPDMNKGALLKLLETSAMLPGMDGDEITPVKAWAMILRDERVRMMQKRDFELLTADLLTKVHCYGFGAVLEEFEVKDAISGIFAAKDSAAALGAFMPQQQQIMAR